MPEYEQQWCSICDQPYETVGPSPARGHDCVGALLKALERMEHERDELRRAITVFLSRHAETAPGCQCVSCQMFRAALAAEEGSK